MDASVKATKKVSSCGSTGHSRCGEAHKQVVSFCCGSTGHSRCGEAHKPGWFCRMRDKSLRRSNPFSLQVIVVSHLLALNCLGPRTKLQVMRCYSVFLELNFVSCVLACPVF